MSAKDELSKYLLSKWTRYSLIVVILVLTLLVTIIFATFIGPIAIPIEVIARILASRVPGLSNMIQQSWPEYYESIVLLIRLPRVALGCLVGCALATAGVTMQAIFRNPIAEPYITGTSAGAAFGASLAIVFGMSIHSLPLLAFGCAILATFIVYGIAKTNGKIPIDTLLLAGIAVSALFSGFTAFLIYRAGEKLHGLIFWLMGGLWATRWEDVIIAFPLITTGIIVQFMFARYLNAFQLGEEEAQLLGIEVEKTKKIVLIFAVLITAIAVAFAGIIGFVGLIIPHIMRLLVGSDHRILFPSATLAGAIFLVLTDTLARSIAPEEFPVGIITLLCGAPFFLYLLFKKKTQFRNVT